jgi:hypothetical protein
VEKIRALGHDLGRLAGGTLGLVVRVLTFPPRVVGRLALGAFRLARAGLRGAWSTARFLGEFSLVASTGVLAGIAVAMLTAGDHELATAVPVNALAGGVIGALTGIVMMVRERRPVAPSPARYAFPGNLNHHV